MDSHSRGLAFIDCVVSSMVRPVACRFLRCFLSTSRRSGQGHALHRGPHLWGHTEVEEDSWMAHLPHRARAAAGSVGVDGEMRFVQPCHAAGG